MMSRHYSGEHDLSSGSKTSLSLLLKIKQGQKNDPAWREFVERYGERIYEWCLNRRLQPSDAEDVTQNILYKLARRLETFDYDPKRSFRGWLRRVTENALNDFYSDQNRLRLQNGSAILVHLELAEARDDLAHRLEEAFDLELFEQAVSRAAQRVSESRFQAWEMATRQGMNGADIASRLDMKVATVYTAKNQVQKLIVEEISKLEAQIES